MSFLYFLPNLRHETLKREALIAAGLGDVFRDRLDNTSLSGSGRLAIAPVVHGPGGLSGLILKPLTLNELPGEADRVGYYVAEQEWRAVIAAGSAGAAGYWIGWDPKKLPTSEQLAREDIVDGDLEQLGDEGFWECPIIRLANSGIGLPDVWALENGKIVSRVKRDWAWAWDLSGQIWDWVDSEVDMDRETVFLWAAKMLGINYRVGPEECSILGLIGMEEMRSILWRAVNGPFVEKIRAAQKKSDVAPIGTAASSTPGSEVTTPDTALPAASST